jgi:hypothetical protein
MNFDVQMECASQKNSGWMVSTVDSSKNLLLHSSFSQVILIVWIGVMNMFLSMKIRARSSRTQWNAMNIYVLARCTTHAVMENVLHGMLEWHFNDLQKQKMIVLTNAI